MGKKQRRVRLGGKEGPSQFALEDCEGCQAGPSPVGAKLNKQLIEPKEVLVSLSACLPAPRGRGSYWA